MATAERPRTRGRTARPYATPVEWARVEADCRGTTDGFKIRLHAGDPDDACGVDGSYYEDGERLIGTFDVRRVTAPMVLGERAELVIVAPTAT